MFFFLFAPMPAACRRTKKANLSIVDWLVAGGGWRQRKIKAPAWQLIVMRPLLASRAGGCAVLPWLLIHNDNKVK